MKNGFLVFIKVIELKTLMHILFNKNFFSIEHCFHDYETKNDSDRYLMECGPEATSAIEHY